MCIASWDTTGGMQAHKNSTCHQSAKSGRKATIPCGTDTVPLSCLAGARTKQRLHHLTKPLGYTKQAGTWARRKGCKGLTPGHRNDTTHTPQAANVVVITHEYARIEYCNTQIVVAAAAKGGTMPPHSQGLYSGLNNQCNSTTLHTPIRGRTCTPVTATRNVQPYSHRPAGHNQILLHAQHKPPSPKHAPAPAVSSSGCAHDNTTIVPALDWNVPHSPADAPAA